MKNFAADIVIAAATLADNETQHDALTDVLFLVPSDAVSCGHVLTGVAGPGGEWAFGEDAGEELPPWIDVSELCVA